MSDDPAERSSEFWSVLHAAGAAPDADPDDVAAQARAHLSAAEPAAIERFQASLEAAMGASYRTDLWGAAYLLLGGCGDDGFEYFRGWLLTRGRETFEATLSDPDDAVARVYEQTPELAAEGECEDVLYVAAEAYRARTGQPMPTRTGAFDDIEFDFDPDDPAELRRRYPRLTAALG